MKNKFICGLVICSSFLCAACTADHIQELDFDVRLRNNAADIHVGDEVVFDFSGDPDYIVFWSGEDGHKYANRNRTKVEVDELSLSYSIFQRYGRAQTNNCISIKISEDFNGVYTKEGIEAAAWTVLSQREDKERDWWVPSGDQDPAYATQGDLTGYKDRRFYLAFHYKTPEVLTVGVQHPRIDINPVSLNKVADGKVVKSVNPEADMGFRHVLIDGSLDNSQVNATTVRFQCKNEQDNLPENVEIWCISQPIDASSVASDKGEPIRSMTVPSDSYTYVFDEAGTYAVTFVARNANAWNSVELIKEIVLDVKD